LVYTITLCLSLIILTAIFAIYFTVFQKSQILSQSNYEIYCQNPLFQPDFFRHSTTEQYRPIGRWTGRLILPSKEQQPTDDFVLFEVHNAAPGYQHLIGQIVILKWSDEPQVQADIKAVTQDIYFSPATYQSQKVANLHPERLNNWARVGPLLSLAGARPNDDVVVLLKDPVIVIDELESRRPIFKIAQEPVQITGSLYGLVMIVEREANSRDRFRVHHFNKTSKQFDGALETIRIPQVTADRCGVHRSTNRDIEKSPLNPFGWYIYGSKDAEGIFVVQAIAPRTLMRLQPDEIHRGIKAGLAYIQKNWQATATQKGTAKIVFLDPASDSLNRPETASQLPIPWQEGDRAIVIHNYGGIGGKKAEPAPLGVVTGHFSYGIAEVVREPLANELCFDIEYQQVYAHNPDGIIAGSIKGFSYLGDLQRGWLANRPVSDVVIKFDAVTQDYDFDGIKLSPLKEFQRQLHRMMARYRIGDGTGAALVTPVTSCVQDSNQALYGTIQQIAEQIQSSPQIQDWLQRHPQHPQSLRFEQVVKLGRSLEKQLAPLGIVPPDWKQHVQTLAGTRPSRGLINTLFRAFISWRTMLPRRAHDEIAAIFLKHGASLWFIRTNQVGGFDPDIQPKAPTAILGHRTG
jgi:predicted Abi (CAAX) family protease